MINVTKKTYNEVITRDKNKCVLCARSGDYYKLDLHHIRGRSRILTNDVKNCIMLCHECHMLVHSNQKKFLPILEVYIDEIYH